MALNLIRHEIRDMYEVHEWRHATAILRHEFPDKFAEVS